MRVALSGRIIGRGSLAPMRLKALFFQHTRLI
jgi:hypothetical protein